MKWWLNKKVIDLAEKWTKRQMCFIHRPPLNHIRTWLRWNTACYNDESSLFRGHYWGGKFDWLFLSLCSAYYSWIYQGERPASPSTSSTFNSSSFSSCLAGHWCKVCCGVLSFLELYLAWFFYHILLSGLKTGSTARFLFFWGDFFLAVTNLRFERNPISKIVSQQQFWV